MVLTLFYAHNTLIAVRINNMLFIETAENRKL